MIVLPALDDATSALWDALLDISERMHDSWTLVGGQMVFLHGVEAGVPPPRISRDLDLVVDVRVRPLALPRMAAALDDLGFTVTPGAAMSGVARRFERDGVPVDVLAPDGVGARADLRLTGNLNAIEIRGGTAALSHSAPVEVDHRGRTGVIMRPHLPGALLIKTAAHRSDRSPDASRHLHDLAFLLSLVADPMSARQDLGPKGRAWLRKIRELDDDRHDAWVALGDRALDAKLAFRIMTRDRPGSPAPPA